MPTINPDHIRHAGGTIKKVSPKCYQAYVRIDGIRHRAQLRNLTTAKLWIEARQGEYSATEKPLTRLELADATKARAILPEGITLCEAAQAYAAAYREVEDGTQMPLAEAVSEFLRYKEGTITPKALGDYRRYLERFSDAIGSTATLDAISRHTVAGFADAIATPSVRNATLRNLSAFFTYCTENDYIKANPCTGVQRARTAPPPLGILSPGDFAEILHRAQNRAESLIPYLVVGAFAGVRPTETLRITPEKIRAEYIILDASVTKTADARTIPIRPNLRAWLDAYPFAITAKDLHAVNRRIARLCKTPSPIAWPHNCLRHSYASYAYELAKNAALTAAEMGHKGTGMFFRHYRALAHPGDGEKWFSIMPG